jgi:hypothetical protein
MPLVATVFAAQRFRKALHRLRYGQKRTKFIPKKKYSESLVPQIEQIIGQLNHRYVFLVDRRLRLPKTINSAINKDHGYEGRNYCQIKTTYKNLLLF